MEPMAARTGMEISSAAFPDGGAIPVRHTCDAEGLLPALHISGVPAEAKSLTLIVDDPDSPNGTWAHWLRFNVDPSIKEIAEGGDVEGGMGKNTASSLGWQAPCPQTGEHRYYFKLYALSSKLDLPDGVTAEDVERAMDGRILAKASFMGRHRRST